VILAGILLKLGGYGILRILIQGFSEGTIFYSPLVSMIALMSLLFSSIIIFRLIDVKKIIAYSSIAHMNLMLLGLFSLSSDGVMGANFLMIGHGLVSGLLFFLVGFLYDRFQTRLLPYYGGLTNVLPIFTLSFLLATLGNIGFPGTCNFIGEMLIFFSLVGKNIFVFVIGLLVSVILSGMYSLFLYSKLFAGTLTKYFFVYKDINGIELVVAFFLIFLIIIFGVNPNLILDLIETYSFLLIEKGK